MTRVAAAARGAVGDARAAWGPSQTLLAVITARKAAYRRREEGAEKRGGAADDADRVIDLARITQVLGDEPTPEFAAEVAEESERLLARLPDVELREIALAKLAGSTNEEIARERGCAMRTVERRLGLIRRVWTEGST